MSVTIAGVTFKNPVLTASGTFGSGLEYAEFIDLAGLGGIVTKGVSNVPWPGNPTPRVAEVSAGMLNAIGLQNPGMEVFIERDLAYLKDIDTRVIVNVCGKSVEDYLDVVRRLQNEAVDMLEINVSCPNVKEGAIAFGQNPDALYDITCRIKKEAAQPVIMKLTPNVTDITQMARAVLANKTGGLSGPAIKPVAVRMVWQAAHAVSIPVIGMGGIASAEDAIEFMMAGATAVAVGAMNFHDPCTTIRVAQGMEKWCASHGVDHVSSLTGIVS